MGPRSPPGGDCAVGGKLRRGEIVARAKGKTRGRGILAQDRSRQMIVARKGTRRNIQNGGVRGLGYFTTTFRGLSEKTNLESFGKGGGGK